MVNTSDIKKEFESWTPEKMSEILTQFFSGKQAIKDIVGLTAEDLEAIYYTGHSNYTHGNYKKADEVFSVLGILDHFNPKFLYALAATRQMLNHYQSAAELYIMVFYLESENPLPLFYAAVCLISLGKLDEAVDNLKAVSEVAAKDMKKYGDLYQKSQSMLGNLTKKEKKE